MDIGNTVSRVRKEYKEYLSESTLTGLKALCAPMSPMPSISIRIRLHFLSGSALQMMLL